MRRDQSANPVVVWLGLVSRVVTSSWSRGVLVHLYPNSVHGDSRQILAPVRLLHRCRTLKVHLQVQQQNEVTIGHQETGAIKPPKKRDHNQATRSRLRDLLEWLEDLTENLEIAEVPAPAEISHHSDPERPINEASRKHSIFIQFPKDLSYGVCKRTKITKAPCRRRTGEAAP